MMRSSKAGGENIHSRLRCAELPEDLIGACSSAVNEAKEMIIDRESIPCPNNWYGIHGKVDLTLGLPDPDGCDVVRADRTSILYLHLNSG